MNFQWHVSYKAGDDVGGICGHTADTVVGFILPAMLRKSAKPRMTRQQQLASRPLRLVDGQMTDGRLTVKIQSRRWSSWLLRLPKGATKTFEFDAIGQMVWSLCDGKNSVQQIARKLAKTYNVSEREAQVATEKFLTMLAKKGLVGAAVKTSKNEIRSLE